MAAAEAAGLSEEEMLLAVHEVGLEEDARQQDRRQTVAGNEPAAGAGGGDMSYVIDEEGYAVLDESAFLGWDSSGSSDSGRTSEITQWSVH